MNSRNLTGLALGVLTLASLAADAAHSPRIQDPSVHAKPVTWDRSTLLDGAHFVRGNAKSKYVLVAFIDYQCPSCRKRDAEAGLPTLPGLKRVAYAVRHFPLPMHPLAPAMARLAVAAEKAGKGPRIHNELMNGKAAFTEKGLAKLARDNGLNYKESIASPENAAVVKTDTDLAAKMKINQIPTYFLVSSNGFAWEMTRPSLAQEVLVNP